LVESLALWHTFGNVDHDDRAGQLFFGNALGGGSADISGAHDGDLINHCLVCESGGESYLSRAPLNDIAVARQ